MSDRLPRAKAVLTRMPSVDASDEFTPEQDEFIREVLKFRTKHRRPPTLIEGFRILKSLGWRKGEPKEVIS